MLPLLAWLAFAARAQAADIPQDALERTNDIRTCWQANPFVSGALPGDDYRSTNWNNACVDQRDACAVLTSDDERAKVKDGYCQSCSTKAPPGDCPTGTSCAPAPVCKTTPERLTLPAPAEGTGGQGHAPPMGQPEAKATCKDTAACISRYVAEAHMDGRDFTSQMDLAWSGAKADRDGGNKAKKCDDLPLRNTEHYLFYYKSRLQDWVFDQFPLSFCGISYGYSLSKMVGIKKKTSDIGAVSPPSLEEAYWGCRGLWDAYDQKVAVGSCN